MFIEAIISLGAVSIQKCIKIVRENKLCYKCNLDVVDSIEYCSPFVAIAM